MHLTHIVATSSGGQGHTSSKPTRHKPQAPRYGVLAKVNLYSATCRTCSYKCSSAAVPAGCAHPVPQHETIDISAYLVHLWQVTYRVLNREGMYAEIAVMGNMLPVITIRTFIGPLDLACFIVPQLQLVIQGAG